MTPALFGAGVHKDGVPIADEFCGIAGDGFFLLPVNKGPVLGGGIFFVESSLQ